MTKNNKPGVVGASERLTGTEVVIVRERAPKPLRDAAGRYLPGQSGNALGVKHCTKREIAKSVRRKVNPDELVDILIDIARGIHPRHEVIEGQPVVVEIPTILERMKAIDMLREYTGGKLPDDLRTLEQELGDGPKKELDLKKLTDEELEQLENLSSQWERLMAKAAK